MSEKFYEVEPSLTNYWRAVILFGLNTASYKFALGKSLLEFANLEKEFINMTELADRFSYHIAEHVKQAPKQSTRKGVVKFFDMCEKFNSSEISKEELVKFTTKNAFNDVIKRFHIINGKEIPKQFYIDERKGSEGGGIRLTDHIHELSNLKSSESLGAEVEARWRLVETAWKLNISKQLIAVNHDSDAGEFYINDNNHRIDVTSSRDSLNGYQKGKCFYCFCDISIVKGSANIAHVDHFFPHSLKKFDLDLNLDGAWNLVLACSNCNGASEKSDKVPSEELLERLNNRNEYLISSNHPLKETIIKQTGITTKDRRDFLQNVFKFSIEKRIHTWQPEAVGNSTF
ncbi:HNH endonuclease [Verrucomicrobia bacterium]|nr:HNH endonuclease [Verrucomicrobiota bacterium]